jgi:drug/metabolite transporter (DMT)-like permease
MTEVRREPTAAGRLDVVGGGLILMASLQFGAVVILGKLATDSGLSVSSFLALRFVMAAVVLAAVLAVVRLPLRAAPGERLPLAVLGTAGYAVEAGLFFAAIQHGSAAAVTLLFYTYPVWVALEAIALGRGLPGWLLGAALASAVAGAALVIVSSGGLDITAAGIGFAFGAALSFSIYLTAVDAVVRRTNPLTGAMWVSGAAGVALAAFAVASGGGSLPGDGVEWAQVVGTAVFTAGAFVCLFAGLRRLGAVRTAIVASTEPLAASVLAVVFLHEPLRAGTVGGGVLILAGAVAASLARRGGAGESTIP